MISFLLECTTFVSWFTLEFWGLGKEYHRDEVTCIPHLINAPHWSPWLIDSDRIRDHLMGCMPGFINYRSFSFNSLIFCFLEGSHYVWFRVESLSVTHWKQSIYKIVQILQGTLMSSFVYLFIHFISVWLVHTEFISWITV